MKHNRVGPVSKVTTRAFHTGRFPRTCLTTAILSFSLTLLVHASVAAAQVQVAPIGSITTRIPTFVWTASPEAQYYSLWVDDAHEEGTIDLEVIMPDAAGCASGSGMCSVSPNVTLASGLASWQLGVKTNAHHSWSPGVLFVVPSPSDGTAPGIAITGPTSSASYVSLQATVVLTGVASDNVGVNNVTWKTDRGGSGTASGTTSWSASVTLQSGSNLVTVTAYDAAGNITTDALTIDYRLPDSAVPASTPCPFPAGPVTSVAPSFCWNPTPGAQWYSLWVDDSHEDEKIFLSTITPAAAGCGDGISRCWVSPGVTLAPGPAYWTVGVRTSTAHSWGPATSFYVPDPNAPCLTLSPESQWHPADEQTGFITVRSNGCTWTATTDAPWIFLTPGWTTGTAYGQVRYELAFNPTGASREADIAIGPREYHVTQFATTTCGATLSGYGDLYDANAHVETVAVQVGTSCSWKATSNVSWVTLRSDSRSGTGPATVRWDVDANTSSAGRSGTLTIAGRTYSVEQHGTASGDPCNTTVTPLSATASSEESTYRVSVSAAAGCQWNANSLSPFIEITEGFNGVGSGSVSYLVHGNTSQDPRTGTLNIASKQVRISQAGLSDGTCAYVISAIDPLPAGQNTGSATVTAPAGCPWAARSESEFLSVTNGASGSGSGTVTFSLAANHTHESRLAALTVAGQDVGVMQVGGAGEPTCVTSVTPTAISVPAIGAAGTVMVSAPSDCVWSIAAGASWLTLSGNQTRSGSGSFAYLTTVNAGGARAVSLHVGSQEITIEQDGAVPTGVDVPEILWPAPEPRKANDCYGNCGGGCGTFLAVCGTNGGNWTSEIRTGLQHIDDLLLEVCSAGRTELGVFPRYAAVVRWTYHGIESPACIAHDSLCRSWAGKLPFGLGKVFCAATIVGPFNYTICEGARPWTWSYEEAEVGRAMFPAAIVSNPSAPACAQDL